MLVSMDPTSDRQAYNVFATNLAQHGVYGWTLEEFRAYWLVGTSVIVEVWPSLVMFVTVIASETFFIFFVLCVLVTYEKRWSRPWIGLLLTRLFWAAATYVRPLALLLPLVFGVAAVLRDTRSPGGTLVATGVICVVMAGAILPWSSQAVFGERVLISTNFGPVFWMGNNPQTTGAYQKLPAWADGLPDTERAARLKDEAFAYVAAEPGAFVWRTIVKFIRQHERETIAVGWNERQILARFGPGAVTALKFLASGFWLIVALGGLVRLVRGRGAGRP